MMFLNRMRQVKQSQTTSTVSDGELCDEFSWVWSTRMDKKQQNAHTYNTSL